MSSKNPNKFLVWLEITGLGIVAALIISAVAFLGLRLIQLGV